MTRFCPVCGKGWPPERSVCGDCLAQLRDDPDATVRCRHCDREWPARMHSCPSCLAELRPDPEAVAEAIAATLAGGHHLPRPADLEPFAAGPACRLVRTARRSSLLFVGPHELVEAYVDGRDHRAVPPLDCRDVDGTVLFRLTEYAAAEGALVATDADGAALATFLRFPGALRSGLHVRDETSAPVARLVGSPTTGGGWVLVETGGTRLAGVDLVDREHDGYVDDEWSFHPERPLPLQPLAAVALLLAGQGAAGPDGSRAVTSGSRRRDWY